MKGDISTRTSEGSGASTDADKRATRARERWLAGQNEAFKSAVNGAPLEVSLDLLIQTARNEIGASRGAFYIANEEGTELHHVVGMPRDYAEKVDGFRIGKKSLACGLAVGTATPVITPDVREEPRWRPWLWLAEEYDYRGCWSFPVESAGVKPFGTFALYFREPRSPTAEDLDLSQSLVRAASIIIAQQRNLTELRESERHAQILLAELQHRVRNTLAVVRSIGRRTAERSTNVEEMVSHFEGRLNAFARVQSAVTRAAEPGIELSSIIDDELLAVAAREGDQLRISGPKVHLRSRPAESISLAVHELATNAVKYGALSVEGGRVRVSWDVAAPDDAPPKLTFKWLETGLPKRPSARREGFGHDMLRRSLPYELQAETDIEFTADGLRFTMRMPLGPYVLAEGA